jgi:hypothetical protein|tara:strand:- start:1086 stop:1223 length:138 start_codon:yes stop_codon:yes gene_type:complete
MDIKNTHESSTSMLRKYSDMVKEMYNPSEQVNEEEIEEEETDDKE